MLIDISSTGSITKVSSDAGDEARTLQMKPDAHMEGYRPIRISWGKYSLDCASGRGFQKSAPLKSSLGRFGLK